MVSKARLRLRIEKLERDVRHEESPFAGLDIRVAEQLRAAGFNSQIDVLRFFEVSQGIYGIGEIGMREIQRWLAANKAAEAYADLGSPEITLVVKHLRCEADIGKRKIAVEVSVGDRPEDIATFKRFDLEGLLDYHIDNPDEDRLRVLIATLRRLQKRAESRMKWLQEADQ